MGALFSCCCPCLFKRKHRENSNFRDLEAQSERPRTAARDLGMQHNTSMNHQHYQAAHSQPADPVRTCKVKQQSVYEGVQQFRTNPALPSGNNYNHDQDVYRQQLAEREKRKRQRELDEQRAEFEQQQKLQRMQQESNDRHNDVLRQVAQQNREFELSRQRKNNENEARIEELRRNAKMENDRKNREDEMAFERMKLENSQRNTVVYNPELDRLREKSLKQDEQFRNNEIRFKNEEMDRTLKYQQAQEEHSLRRQKIDKEFEEKLQKLNEDAQQRQREMHQQYEEIKKIMQMRVWNDIIERNWTNRLNAARSANKDSLRLEHRCLVSNLRPTDIEEWKHVLQILLKNMENESSNMSVMYENTHKSFLLEIQRAVDAISFSCDDLLRELNGGANSMQLKHLSEELNRTCMNIPTLAELKRNYYTEMQNNSQL